MVRVAFLVGKTIGMLARLIGRCRRAFAIARSESAK
jgi:hypothetical protein